MHKSSRRLLTLSEWLNAWETSAEVLKHEMTLFKDDGTGANHPDGHLVLPATMSATQRKHVPEVRAMLGLGFREQGAGSATIITVMRTRALAVAAATCLTDR